MLWKIRLKHNQCC